MSPRSPIPNLAESQAIAVKALMFLANDLDELGRFLAATGLGPENLRQAARDPDFLCAVMDHMAQDERLLIAFANDAGLTPEHVGHAALVLAGPPPGDD